MDSFFKGRERGTVNFVRGARFNTLDRPSAGGRGRWGLLSREKTGCRYNAEYLPQIAAYVEAIEKFGYPSERVFFEHPPMRLDLAILNDAREVVVLGEAKRAVPMLDGLLKKIQDRYSTGDPGAEGGNEARQLAWRLWQTQAEYLWLIGPAERRAYRVCYDPLEFEALPRLPQAKDIGLAHIPEHTIGLPFPRRA